MVTKTVLKVDISCDKCKTKILQIVCGIIGVDKVEVDAEKGMVTIIGEADPFEIIKQLRKAGKFAQVVTVGPPPKPEEKKEEKKCGCGCGCGCPEGSCAKICWVSKQCPCPGYYCSGVCRPVAFVSYDHYGQSAAPCNMM